VEESSCVVLIMFRFMVLVELVSVAESWSGEIDSVMPVARKG
jgi:hypothetical protein